MKYLTLIEAKEHMTVDYDNDDALIIDLIDMVEELVIHDIISNGESIPDPLPLTLKQAMKVRVADFYRDRESTIIGVGMNKIPHGYENLVNRHKNWTIA